MNAFDIILIAAVVAVSAYVCIRQFLINKDEAKKTEKHLIREFFNHFGDGSNYRR